MAIKTSFLFVFFSIINFHLTFCPVQVRTKAAYRCSRFYDAATKSLVPPSPGVPAQLLSEDEISEDIEVRCCFCV